jgi:hypothetical protein
MSRRKHSLALSLSRSSPASRRLVTARPAATPPTAFRLPPSAYHPPPRSPAAGPWRFPAIVTSPSIPSFMAPTQTPLAHHPATPSRHTPPRHSTTPAVHRRSHVCVQDTALSPPRHPACTSETCLLAAETLTLHCLLNLTSISTCPPTPPISVCLPPSDHCLAHHLA